jgi:hypothetical protein
VNFNAIYLDRTKLLAACTGFKVSYKSKLIGARRCSLVWQYRLKLEHYKADGKVLKL